jgi:hypothetical protein
MSNDLAQGRTRMAGILLCSFIVKFGSRNAHLVFLTFTKVCYTHNALCEWGSVGLLVLVKVGGRGEFHINITCVVTQ